MIHSPSGEPATHWWYSGGGEWIALAGAPDTVASAGRRTLGRLPIDQPPKDGLLIYRRGPEGSVETTRAEEFSP